MSPGGTKPSDLTDLVRTAELEWTPLPEPGIVGIYVKVLRIEKGRPITFLLKFDPGASYPAHNHPGGEEVFVLEGEVTFGRDHLSAGDFLYTAPSGKHWVRSDSGCVALFVVPEEVEILNPGTESQ